jgi:hypothetical protein
MRTYQVTIDENVPLSAKSNGEKSRYQHPLSWLLTKLQVGESFVYPATTNECFNGLRSVAHSLGRRLGKKFATRTVKDREGVERLRFWRTA